MTESQRWMPPFPALRAFHAAALHGRFRIAAEELGVTESAVSHQVRRLEDFLHVALFDRSGPRVRLTAAGARYFEEIDPAMTRIREATRALLGPSERARVQLTLPPSLAIYWLIPSLLDFERECPNIDLQLVATTRLCDLRREQIDLAIRHGAGGWSDVEARPLLEEALIPVCKPGYVTLGAGDDLTAALRRCRLILGRDNRADWLEWARARGIPPPAFDTAIQLESQEQVLEVARQGIGLAMGRRPLVDGRLEAGDLVAPFGAPDPSAAAYYLCSPSGLEPTAAARRVMRWLVTLAQVSRPLGDGGAAAS